MPEKAYRRIDPELIKRKLQKLEEYLEKLEEVKEISFGDYQADYFRKSGIERTIQNIVESGADINSHFVSKLAHVAPDDYRDSFIKMGERQILAYDFAVQIAASAGLRNRLVHEYDKIDDGKVHQSIKTTLKQYAQYIRYIKNYLQKFLQ